MNVDFKSLENIIAKGTEAHVVISLRPAEARILLELNTHNQKVKDLRWKKIAQDMRLGRWRFAAEGIKFSSTKFLMDGQHRLLALASLENDMPDLALNFLVSTGLDPEVQAVMDQGVKRSVGGNLQIKGYAYGNEIAAAARTYLLYKDLRSFGDAKSVETRVFDMELQDWILSNEWFIELCQKTVKSRSCSDLKHSVLAATYAIFTEANPVLADEFLHALITGEHLYKGHPVHTLRERLGRIRRETIKVSDRDLVAFTIMAWNALAEGREISKLQRPAQWTKKNFPRVAGIELALAA